MGVFEIIEISNRIYIYFVCNNTYNKLFVFFHFVVVVNNLWFVNIRARSALNSYLYYWKTSKENWTFIQIVCKYVCVCVRNGWRGRGCGVSNWTRRLSRRIVTLFAPPPTHLHTLHMAVPGASQPASQLIANSQCSLLDSTPVNMMFRVTRLFPRVSVVVITGRDVSLSCS